jgi:eukaryotic-like serine/threonine-protein kinase
MGSTYRCENPNCGFSTDRFEDAGSVTARCPVCHGEATLVDDSDFGDRTHTLGSGGADLTDRTRTLSGGRDVTDRPELDDSHKATMSLPETDSGGEPDRWTLSLPSGHTQERRNNETRPGASPPPATIGRFQIQACLGEGAFGIVYRAYDPQLDRPVALKVAKPGSLDTPEKRDRFLVEAKSAANLRHPNIVPLYEIGSEGDSLFICSALIEGRTLECWMQEEGGQFPPEEAVRITRRLAEALAYAHSVGIIHRDVKPQNVLVDARNEPHLTDFGLAARQTPGEERSSRDRFVLGTPAYMAPEQAEGASEEASDQYSLGCSLYEMLAGVTPFAGGPIQQIYLHKSEPAPPLRRARRDISRDIEAICRKTLEKNPRARYADCGELAEDLRRYAAGEPTKARPPGRLERVAKWAKRSPFQAATALTVAGLIVAVFAVIYSQKEAAAKDARIQGNELAELRRSDGVRAALTDLYQLCRTAADEAKRLGASEGKALPKWAEVERDASSAVRLVENEPDRDKLALLPLIRELREEARLQLADARSRAEARASFPALQLLHGEAVLFGSEYSGLDANQNADRTRDAVKRGLELFRVTPDNDGPPVVDRDYFNDRERSLIADRCCELLLLDVERLARPIPGEHIDVLKARLREAVKRIDRSERLFDPSAPTRIGQEFRARCLKVLGDQEGSEAAKKSAAGIEPRLAADQVLLALDRYRKGDFTEAIGMLSAALREQPDHFGADYLLAVCRLRKGQYPEAREGLSRCLEKQPKLVWPKLLRAYAAIEMRRFDEAEADLDAVAKNPPDGMAAYVARVNRGVLDINRRRFDAAIDNLKAAIKEKPGASSAHLNLAVTYLKRGEILVPAVALHGGGAFLAAEAGSAASRKDALNALDEGVRNCPPNVRIFHERGRVRLTLGDFTGAQEDFRRAVELAVDQNSGSTLADDLIELGRLMVRDGQHPEAIRAFRTALIVRPDRAVAHRLLAQPLLAIGKTKEAGEALDQYLQTVPLTPGIAPTPEQKKTLAEIYQARGQVFEDEARAYRTRGVLHLSRNSLRPAIDSYTHSLNYVPDAETYCFRGWAYLLVNAPELAESDFEDALQLNPRSANALLGRANARVKVGKLKEAVRDADEGVKLAENDVRHLYNAARVYAQAVPTMKKNTPFAKGVEGAFHATCERKAVELLRQALERTPVTERPNFWQSYIEKDSAFENIRNGNLLTALNKEYDRPR